MESLNEFQNICISPAPAKCRARSPPSRAGRPPCPGCLGCEEPGRCQPPPPPVPRASPVSLRPWRGTEEEVTQQKKVKIDCLVRAPRRSGFWWLGGSCVWGEGPVGAAPRLIPVEATSPFGLIYTLQPEEKPLETRRRMLLYVVEMRDRIKEEMATNTRLNQVHLAGSGH